MDTTSFDWEEVVFLSQGDYEENNGWTMEKWRLVSLLVRRKKERCAKLRCGVGHSMFMSLFGLMVQISSDLI